MDGPPNRKLGAEVIRDARLASPENFLRQHFPKIEFNPSKTAIYVPGMLRTNISSKDNTWVACDWHEGAIGDNISLVQYVLPKTSFYDAVFLLTGFRDEKPTTVAPAPPPKPERERRPKIPYMRNEKQGRAYLQERGISLASIQHAEKSGALRYLPNAVMFCGFETRADIRCATLRYIEPIKVADGTIMTKRDLYDSNKSYPCVIEGGKRLVIVEGGTNALAIRDMALRHAKEPPTIIITGGVGVRAWLQTPHIRKMLEEATDVTITGENEKDRQIQTRTDAQRKKLADEIAPIRQGEIPKILMPPSIYKDAAEWNLAQQQVPEPTEPPSYVYRPR